MTEYQKQKHESVKRSLDYLHQICYNLGETMPLKIKKLKAALSRAGFYSRSAKGSHTVWRHPANPAIRVTLSGKDGSDAQEYQIDDVREALRKVGKEL